MANGDDEEEQEYEPSRSEALAATKTHVARGPVTSAVGVAADGGRVDVTGKGVAIEVGARAIYAPSALARALAIEEAPTADSGLVVKRGLRLPGASESRADVLVISDSPARGGGGQDPGDEEEKVRAAVHHDAGRCGSRGVEGWALAEQVRD